jgi:hypothetical protein
LVRDAESRRKKFGKERVTEESMGGLHDRRWRERGKRDQGQMSESEMACLGVGFKEGMLEGWLEEGWLEEGWLERWLKDWLWRVYSKVAKG